MSGFCLDVGILLTPFDTFLRFFRVGAQAVFRNISGRHLESFFGVLALILMWFFERFGVKNVLTIGKVLSKF